MKRYRSPRALYNSISNKYAKNRDKASNDVTELPTVMALAGDIKGKKVLDIGCGLGKHAREFIKRGAQVTGFDASEEMVFLTRKLCRNQGDFFVGNFETISLPNRNFDLINASLSLHYSKNLPTVFPKLNRWLKPGGTLIFSTMHPVWYQKYVPDLNWVKPRKIYFHINSYDVDIFNYYQPLSFYIDLLRQTGFRLEKLIETVISRRYRGWSEEKYRLPNAFVFKAVLVE